MKKKILFSANLDSFFIKFLIPQLKYFKEKGYEVHIASKSENIDIPYCDKKFDVCFARSLNFSQNLKSYKQMKEILSNEHYDLISCHTPFGGAITRLAAKKVKLKDTKLVYMAHGFHFYEGAPLVNWLLYYTAEKYFSKYTDDIITINSEDYELATKKFKKPNIHLVKGVGLDSKKFEFTFTKKDKEELLKSLNIPKNSYIMIYPAELLPRKRQIWLMKTLEKTLKEHSDMHLLLPGKDSMGEKCQKLAKKLGIDKQVHFLGFRKDIPKLLKIADLAVSSSRQEGLPVNVMEAIYCELPIVVTSCRGNRDLIENGKNGFIVPVNDKEEFVKKVIHFYNMTDLKNIKKNNARIVQSFLLDNVLDSIVEIYE